VVERWVISARRTHAAHGGCAVLVCGGRRGGAPIRPQDVHRREHVVFSGEDWSWERCWRREEQLEQIRGRKGEEGVVREERGH
jgi:hypothetical protein